MAIRVRSGSSKPQGGKKRLASGRFGTTDQELIETSLKRFKFSYEAESEAREAGLEDLRFSIGEGQWDAAIKASRAIEGRPCLTVNRIPTFLRQYTGEERQHRPAMLVDPVGSKSDPETAEICQGILRHIEQVSFADYTYDTAYDMMLRIGWHDWLITTEYINERSFDQEPRIVPIDNPFAVYLSPIRASDGNDPLWAHLVQDMSREEYDEEFPDSAIARTNFTGELGNAAPLWLVKDGVRIAQYWWMELERKTLCLLDDGSTKFADELADGEKEKVEHERDVVTRTVKCVKHNAVEILQRYEWLGRYIPVVELSGVRLNVNGKIYRAGMVRDARDPQILYNFEVTGMAEQLALTPKNPLFVAEGSIENHEEEYRQANRKNYPFLYYKATDENGKPLPPPQRANRESDIQSMAAMVQQSDYDLKSVIGIYGPGLGEQGPAQESGFSILTRQQQSDTGSVNWADNLNRAIRWQGKILLDLFPKLIDAPRVQRIIKPDDSISKAVVMNSTLGEDQPNAAQAMLDGQALKKVYDLGLGEYDVTLSSGPTYRTGRQEAFRALTAIVTANPQLFAMVGDIWAKNADWPDAHLLAERLQKMLPPQLQSNDATDPQQQVTALTGQLQALSAQHNQLVQELNRASDTIRTKRLDIESRERVAAMNGQVQLALQMLKSEGAAALAAAQATYDTISHRMQLLHEDMTVDQDAGPDDQNPELPSQVQPKTAVIASAPTPRPEPVGPPQGNPAGGMNP